MAYVIDRTTKEISTRDTVEALADPSVLVYHKREIPAEVLAAPPQYRVIDGDDVRVATVGERFAIDAAIAEQQFIASRAAAIAAIDARSAALISQGLQVNGGSPVSLSLAAQTNLLNIAVAMQMGALQLPQDISRLDGRSYTIKDAADAVRIARLAGGRIKAVLDSGRELRASVLAATTQAEIEAVTDERT